MKDVSQILCLQLHALLFAWSLSKAVFCSVRQAWITGTNVKRNKSYQSFCHDIWGTRCQPKGMGENYKIFQNMSLYLPARSVWSDTVSMHQMRAVTLPIRDSGRFLSKELRIMDMLSRTDHTCINRLEGQKETLCNTWHGMKWGLFKEC